MSESCSGGAIYLLGEGRGSLEGRPHASESFMFLGSVSDGLLRIGVVRYWFGVVVWVWSGVGVCLRYGKES